jgi:hypothetical protein
MAGTPTSLVSTVAPLATRTVTGTLALLLGAILIAIPSSAQAQARPGTGQGRVLDGSPAPEWPVSSTRDDRGRATVRAIRLDAPLELDGQLDESVYSDYAPFGDFVQVVPIAGDPSSERTDVWVMFDDENIYLTCRCWDEAPPEEWVINEYRRDTPGLRNNEHFGVMFDTFYDRRNGMMFYANALGARADYAVIDEGSVNTDWNPVWDVKGGQFDGGWVVEMAIPFKSLRYISGPDQMWGIQFRRSIRHKNEWTYLNPVPPFLAGPQALNRISSAGTLVGLDLPAAGNNLELKPYAIGSVSTNNLSDPPVSKDADGDVGFDLKYGITANLTADLTYNTDFAQVEVDEQQVNLTRFSLFFPEKREFFLEGRGVFDFGRGGLGGFRPGGGTGRFGGGGGDTPTMFYSRRIGLDQGEVVPILAGGRVTGKEGPWAIGAVNIQTQDVEGTGIEGTNFSVVRLKRDILGRSAIGGIFTNRNIALTGDGSNQAYGLDASFAFGQNLEAGAYWAQTQSQGVTAGDDSWQAALNYSGDQYGLTASHLKVGEGFNPEIGFVRRFDFQKSAGSLRFSPRPASIQWIRKLTWEASIDYFDDGDGRMQSRRQLGRFDVEMENSDRWSIQATREFERIDEAFPISSDLDIPIGRYTFTSYRASYNSGTQRRIAGNIAYQWGGFYHGTIQSLNVNQSRVVVNSHLSLEPGFSLNWIETPDGEATQAVYRLRLDYAFTPRMFFSSLVQYNEAAEVFSSNLRFRWEYLPGSELFLVWTDEQNYTSPGGFGGVRSRGFTIKGTRLLRF